MIDVFSDAFPVFFVELYFSVQPLRSGVGCVVDVVAVAVADADANADYAM